MPRKLGPSVSLSRGLYSQGPHPVMLSISCRGLQTMATYGYKRVSTDGQEDGTSLDHQQTKIIGLSMMQDLGSVTFFEDVCSGSIPLGQRDGGKAMLDVLQPGDNVLVTKLD